jgi:hypothetical protein
MHFDQSAVGKGITLLKIFLLQEKGKGGTGRMLGSNGK